jgi:hypothetical protein
MNSFLSISAGGDALPPSWTAFTHNLPATPSLTDIGAAVTAGANDTKGTIVDLLGAPLSHDVELLYIGIHGFNASGDNGSALMDIMVDPAGGTDWSVLIPNLLAGWSLQVNTSSSTIRRNYYFPIQIASGSTIGARAQTALGSDDAGRVVVYAVGGNENPGSWWAGTSVEAIGVDTDNSIGQLHTGGNSGAFSSWTNLGAPISSEAKAVQWAVQGENDAAADATLIHRFDFGSGSARIGQPIYIGSQFAETSIALPTMIMFNTIPASTQLQVRGTCSGTAVPIDVAAYVVS